MIKNSTFFNSESLTFHNYSSSSKGVLAKNVSNNYIYKTGAFSRPNFSCVEPVTECICSDILDLMNMKHAKYELVNVTVKSSDLWKEQKVICCRSKLFTK